MANLFLTKQCNLHCQYCFANEFVNKDSTVMSYENVLRCLDFLSSDYEERIGLIGGEPTLHPQLREILAHLIQSPFRSVCLFTNGILLDRFFNELRNSKFQILVNLNAPEQIGQSNYNRILDNLEQMIHHMYMRDQVGIGLNIYSPDMDYEYIIDVLQRFSLNRIRLSITVPNGLESRSIAPLDYFKAMSDCIRTMLRRFLEMSVAFQFDCNYLPFCLLTEEDKTLFAAYPEVMERTNLFKVAPICSPVLDILPDLQVVRCFGMSDLYKVNLLDFQNTRDLKRHFEYEIDTLAYHILPDVVCGRCASYLSGKCSCGCYAYRMQKIKALRDKLRCGNEKPNEISIRL